MGAIVGGQIVRVSVLLNNVNANPGVYMPLSGNVPGWSGIAFTTSGNRCIFHVHHAVLMGASPGPFTIQYYINQESAYTLSNRY